MKISKLVLRSMMLIVVFMLVTNPVAGVVEKGLGYGGYISNNKINQGDRVVFSGVFHNTKPSARYVYAFNVSFVEVLGAGTTKTASKPNITRLFDTTAGQVNPGDSFTETISQVIDFNPGTYNVSLFFAYSDISRNTQSANLNTTYALANVTFSIGGLTQGLEILRAIGYIIGGLAVVVIGLLIYNWKFRKSY